MRDTIIDEIGRTDVPSAAIRVLSEELFNPDYWYSMVYDNLNGCECYNPWCDEWVDWETGTIWVECIGDTEHPAYIEETWLPALTEYLGDEEAAERLIAAAARIIVPVIEAEYVSHRRRNVDAEVAEMRWSDLRRDARITLADWLTLKYGPKPDA